MPLYTYECQSCKDVTEEVQGIKEDALTDCKKCNSVNSLTKILQASSIRFNGTGFYETDYAHNNFRGKD